MKDSSLTRHGTAVPSSFWLGKIVTVIVDRPLGSTHPEYRDMIYPVNYGYIPNVTAPDGEEQDAYILGIGYPTDVFTGQVIAVIHRNDDTEEKLVVAPEGKIFTSEQITEQVGFTERYFRSTVIMS